MEHSWFFSITSITSLTRIIENLFCAGTYKKVLEHVAKPVLDECKLLLSTKVTKVETSDDRVSVWTDKGDRMKFDEVVFTAPLGWLKKNAWSVFSPPLPKRMSQAISNIGYGNLEKVRFYQSTSKLLPMKTGLYHISQGLLARGPNKSR
jgi:predicted NAD/FAD-dependent oxidoreductase